MQLKKLNLVLTENLNLHVRQVADPFHSLLTLCLLNINELFILLHTYCNAQHSIRLAAKSEAIISSIESLTENPDLKSTWTSSVQPAYYNGQLIAVKHIQKPFVTLTKAIILEINQVKLI